MQLVRIQSDLRIVAYLFILHGGCAILKFLIALQRSNIRIDFGVLCLFAGFGLLRLSVGWWKFAKIYNMLYLIGMPIAMLFFANATSPLTATIMSTPIGEVSKEFSLLLCGMGWLITLWEYRVLTKHSSRELYEPSGSLYWEQ
ncbi:MAG: hypothetical protein RL240_3743 [Planctomycetota bacterium]